MFQLKNVSFKNILSIESLHIEEEKIHSIVGPSGSGKTTLLRLLNKMTSPDSGQILYRGKDIESIDSIALRREILMLGQLPAIFPGTVEDNLTIGLKFSEKDPPSPNALKEAMDFVELSKDLKGDAHKLSGGEKQRLALARILLMNGRVILLDEPSSSLDAQTEDIIMDKLTHYAQENKKTLIMVTHSLEIAKKYSQAIIYIKEGKIEKKEEVQ